MGKTISFRRQDVAGPPSGEPWIWHTVTLLRSQAWRGKSEALALLLEFLEIEHLSHGGTENGRLFATYDALVDFGIGHRRKIKPAITEGQKRRLVVVAMQGADFDTGKRLPTRYGLTYLPTCRRIDTGAIEWSAPANDWMRFQSSNGSTGNSETRFHHRYLPDTTTGTRARKYFEAKRQKPSSADGI